MVRAGLVAIFALGLPLAAAAQEGGPLAVVTRVMQLQVWASVAAVPGEEKPFSEGSLDENFSAEFAESYRAVKALELRLDEELIHYDLIYNSQAHCPPLDLRVEEIGLGTDGKEIVLVSFGIGWCFEELPDAEATRVTKVAFRLIQEGGAWRIDDFDSDGSGSVRAVLAELASI